MATSRHAKIIGIGSFLPAKILTNQDLEKMMDTSDEWISSRTGIKERRIANAEEFASTMGYAAAQKALAQAKCKPEEIDLILVATMSPDYAYPSTAALIQAALGASRAAAMDIQAACSGFIYGLSVAKSFIESGAYQTILFVAAEKMSALLDYQDRSTSVLFGDGAAAVVISASGNGLRIGTTSLGADGSLAEVLFAPAGGTRCPITAETIEKRMHYLKMNGPELFKHAVRRMSHAAAECLAKSGLSQEELRWLIPHQANSRIIDAIAKSLQFPKENIYKTLHKYGNTSASSIAIALDELCAEQPISAGQHLLLVAFGAGLTWGASLLTAEPINDK